MTVRTLARPPALAVAAAVLGLAGCSAPVEAPAPRVEVAAATQELGTVLTATPTAQLGTVVVDGQGYTLYRFDEDTTRPPASTCAGECAQTWPPVLATPGTPLTVEGVAQDAVGTINRPDGSIQLTLGGRPVYRYSGDTEPGATAGQGVSDAWAAVTPDGGKAASVEA